MTTEEQVKSPKASIHPAAVFAAVFAALLFLDINLERLMVRGLFGLSFAFVAWWALRLRIGRCGGFAWYDYIVAGVLFMLLCVTSMIAATASVLYPFLLAGLLLITAVCWGFRRPVFRHAGHLFMYIWLPAALYCCLCMWWMNYMQKVIPKCDKITTAPCPAQAWINPMQSRYDVIIPEGTDYAAVIYTWHDFWETLEIGKNTPGGARVRKPGFKGRVAQNRRDGKLYFLTTTEIPAEKYAFEPLVDVVDVENDFSLERRIDISDVSPLNKLSHISALYYLEETRELFVAGSMNEIRVWKEPGMVFSQSFDVPNMNPLARYIVKDNIYDIAVSTDRKIYTAEWTGFVSEIDPDTERLTRRVFLFSPVSALALSPDEATLYALTTAGGLYSISRKTFTPERIAKVSFGTRKMHFAKERGLLFIGNYITGDVYVYNIENRRLEKVFNAGKRIQGFAWHKGRELLLASSACGVFAYRIDGSGVASGETCPAMEDNISALMSGIDRFPGYMFPALNPSLPAFKVYFSEMYEDLADMRSTPLVPLSLAAFAFLFSITFGAKTSKFADIAKINRN